MRLFRAGWVVATAACLMLLLGFFEPVTSVATPASCVPTGAASSSDMVLNEILPLPASDWNGDGAIGLGDSFVEILNRGASPSSLSGWSVSNGSATFTIPRGSGSSLGAGGRLTLFGSSLGSSFLVPAGGYVALLDNSGTVIDDCHYTTASPDISFARLPDGSQTWSTAPPSPGQPNAALAVPTPTLAPTSTSTSSPTVSATSTTTTSATPSPTPTATPTGGPSATGTPLSTATAPSATPTWTATATPVGPSAGAVINEVLVVPNADWNGDGVVSVGDQAIEITGTSNSATNLSGWSLTTNLGQEYTLPRGLAVTKGHYLTLYESQTRLLLAATGGAVQLRDVAGNLADETSFGQTSPGASWARVPDGTGPWQGAASSPGGPNAVALPSPIPSATPTTTPDATPYAATPVGGAGTHLELSQVLSNPSARDWDGDGVISSGDQFITVVNPTSAPIDVADYQLRDSAGTTFVFPRGVRVEPKASLTVFASQTLLTLAPAGDSVALLAPDGSPLDRVRFGAMPFDMAVARSADGSWRIINPAPPPPSLATPTPISAGSAGDPVPSASAPSSPQPNTLRSVSASRSRAATHHVRLLRALPHLTQVTIEGQVTYPAGLLLGPRAMVLQQDSAAALVRATFDLPPLPINQIVSVTGRVYQSAEGTEIVTTLPEDVRSEEMGVSVAVVDATWEASQEATSPQFGDSTAVVPAIRPRTLEGVLTRITGAIAARRPHAWNVDVGGRRVSAEGPALGEIEPSLHGKASIDGVLIYRITAPDGGNPRYAPFSSLLRRSGEYVVLVRGAFDIRLEATPTPTQPPKSRPSEKATQPSLLEPPSGNGRFPVRWPHVGEGGARGAVSTS